MPTTKEAVLEVLGVTPRSASEVASVMRACWDKFSDITSGKVNSVLKELSAKGLVAWEQEKPKKAKTWSLVEEKPRVEIKSGTDATMVGEPLRAADRQPLTYPEPPSRESIDAVLKVIRYLWKKAISPPDALPEKEALKVCSALHGMREETKASLIEVMRYLGDLNK